MSEVKNKGDRSGSPKKRTVIPGMGTDVPKNETLELSNKEADLSLSKGKDIPPAKGRRLL